MEKKVLTIYICLCVLLACLFLVENKNLVFNSNLENAEYIFHTNSINENIKNQNCYIVENGENYIIKCNGFYASNLKKLLTGIKGETIKFSGTKQDVFNFLKQYNAEYVTVDEFDGRLLIDAFTNQLPNFLYIKNEKTNLQISYKDGQIVVGYPYILGDF